LRDDEAFLAVVTPEPLATFFQKPAEDDRLYDRLAMIIGTPGSGKTTLARLFQYPTLRTLLCNRALSTYKPLLDTLTACGAIADERPTLIGSRLPLETEYREFWEFREVGGSRLMFSPVGSKVMALGALMAALERDLPVAYLEAIGYDLDGSVPTVSATSDLVHIWLEGDVYPQPRPALHSEAAIGR
jgi:hypothetical protein